MLPPTPSSQPSRVIRKATKTRTAVDLFSGAGGFSLGLRRAGFSVVLANEFSVDPEWSYRHNLIPNELPLEDRPLGADVNEMRQHRHRIRDCILAHRRRSAEDSVGTMRGGDISEALSDVWLQRWMNQRSYTDVDLLVAGPPCQGFSSAGSRDDNDQRNRLVFEAIRVVHVLRPKIVVIENVPGMLTRHNSILMDVGRRLSSGSPGYFLAIELLHSVWLGVPQTRKRLVLVGIRRDLMDSVGHENLRLRAFPMFCPSLQAGSCHASAGNSITAHEALGDLAPDPPLHDSPTVPQRYRQSTEDSAFRCEMRAARLDYLEGQDSVGSANELYWNHESSAHNETVKARMKMLRKIAVSDELSKAQRCSSKWLRQRFIGEHPELETKKAAQRVLLPDCWPGLTVTSLPDDIVHFNEDRIPTVREVARLQTFPDWFEFKGVRTTGFERRRAGIYVPQYTQVANAVPPRLAHAVAANVQGLLDYLERDRTCSWLPDSDCLRLYEPDVNPPGTIVRRSLDALNEYFMLLAARRT